MIKQNCTFIVLFLIIFATNIEIYSFTEPSLENIEILRRSGFNNRKICDKRFCKNCSLDTKFKICLRQTTIAAITHWDIKNYRNQLRREIRSCYLKYGINTEQEEKIAEKATAEMLNHFNIPDLFPDRSILIKIKSGIITYHSSQNNYPTQKVQECVQKLGKFGSCNLTALMRCIGSKKS